MVMRSLSRYRKSGLHRTSTVRPAGLKWLVGMAFMLITAVPQAATTTDAELRCGAQFQDTAKVALCLEQAIAEAEALLSQAQSQLLHSLRQAQPRFRQLQDMALSMIESALAQADRAWRNFKDSQCRFYEELHTAIGEPKLEQLSCQLRAVQARAEELRKDADFWTAKFPVEN